MAVTGSLTTVIEQGFAGYHRAYRTTWTSDASAGTVGGTTLTVAAGRLVSLKVVPSGGATAPTALYDLLLVDADGYDVLGGKGADLSATAGATLVWNPPLPFPGGTLEPQIANAGNSKVGTLVLTIDQRP